MLGDLHRNKWVLLRQLNELSDSHEIMKMLETFELLEVILVPMFMSLILEIHCRNFNDMLTDDIFIV